MSEYQDKMLGLRKSTTQALDEPKPAYRVMSVDPKMGNLDDQFALIESAQAYGSPASDPIMRRIVVGDSLPEGEVTAITGDGIQVIPDYGDEYIIPLGGRPGYKPPLKKKPPPVQTKSPSDEFFDYQKQAESLINPKMAAMLKRTNYGAGAKHISDQMRDFLDEQGITEVERNAVDVNAEVYAPYLEDSEDMTPEQLQQKALDAAAKNYGQQYENQQPVSESTVELDGVEYAKEIFGDGAVFFVPTGEDGDYMRGHNEKENK
tara:strand:+ start:60 stop:845 length:786 start_codon:yes stop_codon:yes gene_type:complete